jgi:hypothetical protein
MNKNTAQQNSNCQSGCEPQKENDKHDADEMKHAADHKMKGGKKSAGKKIEKTPKQQA